MGDKKRRLMERHKNYKCADKNAYSSIRMARRIAQRQLHRDPTQTLFIYLCRSCKQYHLTSRRGGLDVIEEVTFNEDFDDVLVTSSDNYQG